MHLGHISLTAWSVDVRAPEGTDALHLTPGGTLLCRGMECDQWRFLFRGYEYAELTLNYVEEAGQYVGWKYDRHDGLNTHAAESG